MSSKLVLFNAIVAKIQADVKEVKTIKLWNSQLDNEPTEKAFNFPGLFVEFGEILWTTHLNPPRIGSEGNIQSEQKSDPSIVILHCAFSHLENETISFPKIDPILEKIFFAMQGLADPCFTPLKREGERQDTDHNRVIDWQMDFSTSFIQAGEPDPDLEQIDAGTLEIDITTDLDIDNPIIRSGDGVV